MLRIFLGGVVALGLMAAAVSAQSNVDCGVAYKRSLDKLKREKVAKMSDEQLAALKQKAQRIYDACGTGDLVNAKALFEGLERSKN